MINTWKNSKLGRRIIAYVLIAALGMGLVVFGISMGVIYQQEKSATALQTELADLSANESRAALLSQAENSLLNAAVMEAENKNQIFQLINGELDMLTGLLERINRSETSEGTVPPSFSETENGVEMGRAAVAGTDEPNDTQITQLCRISLMEDTIASLYDNESLLRNILVGTTTGVFYRYSDYNDFETDYDPRTRNWYLRALEKPDTIVWSNAYVETYGHLVVKCSKTYRDENGEIAGVIALDIGIETMVENILSADSDTYTSFILDSTGSFVAKPDRIPDDFIAPPAHGGEESCYTAVTEMTAGKSGICEVQLNGQPYYAAFAPVTETGWSFCLLYSRDALIQPVQEIGNKIDSISTAEHSKMDHGVTVMRIRFVAVVFICTILVSLLAVYLANKILRPVNRLSDGLKQIGKGNLQVKLNVEGDDEIAQLGHAFNKMSDDLQQHIRELNAVTAEKQRISTELNLATEIQSDMLPNLFPPFPERREFDIYATMNPAKEVGGDFYDFFLIDNDHLAMLIADVSGKGIPAALFMMISKTILKTRTENGGTPAEILRNVNNSLCENNEAEMFVTCWLGIYEISSGKLTAANAGHEFPALRHAGGQFELLKDKHGFVLAGMEDSRYRDYEITLEKGDSLFIYTDGVTEATDAVDQLFGTERLISALNINPDASPEDLLLNVRAEVDKFVGEAEQFDDLTMLAFRRNQ